MAALREDNAWLRRQRWREERMRYEVLAAVYEGCGRRPGCTVSVSRFTEEMGVWREELFRVLEFLDRTGYILYHGAGPLVSITERGIDHMEHREDRRRSIRG